MNPKLIVIDGKTYQSVDEMPPDIRQKYEQAMRALGDANDNQIPDAFETINIFADKNKDGVPDVLGTLVAGHAAASSMKIIIDGKEFDGLDGLPPESRAKFQEAMRSIDANRNGVPDVTESIMRTANQNKMATSSPGMGAQHRSTSAPANSTVTPETSNGWMLVLSGLFLFLLCLAGVSAVWYFFLR